MLSPVHSTYKSHLNAGFVSEKSLSDRGLFYVAPGKCEQTPGNPLQESIRAAKLIEQTVRQQAEQTVRNTTPQTLWLCMSGGIDSECMALSFLAAQVSFKAAICRFNNGLNDFDIDSAISFCEQNKIPYEIFPFDLFQFYESGQHLIYAEKYGCNSPQLTAHMAFIQSLDGPAVCAWNPPAPMIVNDKLSIVLPTDRYIAFDRLYSSSNKLGTYFFFLYTPELFYSFLNLPFFQKLILGTDSQLKKSVMENPYQFKCKLYQEAGFDVQAREDKFTGFERVKKYYETQHNRPNEPVYEELFRYPLQKMRPDPVDVLVSLDTRYFLNSHHTEQIQPNQQATQQTEQPA